MLSPVSFDNQPFQKTKIASIGRFVEQSSYSQPAETRSCHHSLEDTLHMCYDSPYPLVVISPFDIYPTTITKEADKYLYTRISIQVTFNSAKNWKQPRCIQKRRKQIRAHPCDKCYQHKTPCFWKLFNDMENGQNAILVKSQGYKIANRVGSYLCLKI